MNIVSGERVCYAICFLGWVYMLCTTIGENIRSILCSFDYGGERTWKEKRLESGALWILDAEECENLGEVTNCESWFLFWGSEFLLKFVIIWNINSLLKFNFGNYLLKSNMICLLFRINISSIQFYVLVRTLSYSNWMHFLYCKHDLK